MTVEVSLWLVQLALPLLNCIHYVQILTLSRPHTHTPSTVKIFYLQTRWPQIEVPCVLGRRAVYILGTQRSPREGNQSQEMLGGWRDSSAGKSIGCSCGGPSIDLQLTTVWNYSPRGHKTLFLVSGTHTLHRHISR